MITLKLRDVATYAWNNAIEVRFGNKHAWDENTFKYNWYTDNYPNVWEVGGASGLYWFLVKDKSIKDLKNIKTPDKLPAKAIRIAETTKMNLNIFQENLCEPDESGFLVIYNGHEQKVFGRIRSHFALDNDDTTAIGFGKYEMAKYDLRVRIFHNKLPMKDLINRDRDSIKNLLNEKAGREAVESCWRAFNGWPVLCKR